MPRNNSKARRTIRRLGAVQRMRTHAENPCMKIEYKHSAADHKAMFQEAVRIEGLK